VTDPLTVTRDWAWMVATNKINERNRNKKRHSLFGQRILRWFFNCLTGKVDNLILAVLFFEKAGRFENGRDKNARHSQVLFLQYRLRQRKKNHLHNKIVQRHSYNVY
jgi:hypothetical protein